jgi:Flp pilus assembly pilin Flp
MHRKRASERGSASVEQAGLVALIALLLLAAIAAVAAGGEIDAGRSLAGAISRRIACAPQLPDDCRHHPLVPAYGWPLARLARVLAPLPVAKPGPTGLPLVPVDFRYCRHESCAVAAGPHLTASRRRTTVFTQIDDQRRSRGWVELTYWLYRPGLGWERQVRRATQADSKPPVASRYSSRTTPPWSRSRPFPAATTTSPPPNDRLGSGASKGAIRAGRADACITGKRHEAS